MYFAITLLLSLGLSWTNEAECGTKPDRRNLIVRGNDANVHEYPWMVSLSAPGGSHFCGASIIRKDVILTAAHCVEDATAAQLQVTVGEHDFSSASETQVSTVRHSVKQVIVHEQYDSQTTANDIALLILDSDIAYSEHVHSICMPDSTDAFPWQEEVVVTGWGTLDDGGRVHNLLQEVAVELHNHDYCKIFYGFTYESDSMICANTIIPSADTVDTGLDSCQGDSGGPLVYENKATGLWEQVGVVSWGYGCANALAPGIYTHLENYIEWVTVNAATCEGALVAQCEATCAAWAECMIDPCPTTSLTCANAPAICTSTCMPKRGCLSTFSQASKDCVPVVCPNSCVDSWIGDNYCDQTCVERCPQFTDAAGVVDGGDCVGRSAIEQARDYLKFTEDKDERKEEESRSIMRNAQGCHCPANWAGDNQCDLSCIGCESFWSGNAVESGTFDGGDCGQASTICEICFGGNEMYVMGECARGSPFVNSNWLTATSTSQCAKATADTKVMLDCVAATDCGSCTAAGPECQWSVKADVCVSKYITSPGDLTRTCPSGTQAPTTTRTPSTTTGTASTTRGASSSGSPVTTIGAPTSRPATTRQNDENADEILGAAEAEESNTMLIAIAAGVVVAVLAASFMFYRCRSGKSAPASSEGQITVISGPTLTSFPPHMLNGTQPVAAPACPTRPPALPNQRPGGKLAPSAFAFAGNQNANRGLPPPPVRTDLW